jgi:hypothetical protein
LMYRDAQGIFWMLDADDGAWFCNRGEAWEPGDPRAARSAEAAQLARHKKRRQSLGRALAWVVVLVVLLGVGIAAVVWRWPPVLWARLQPPRVAEALVQVTIASPHDGSQVALDQEVAVESTIDAATDLGMVSKVELQVNEATVDSQSVRPRVQQGQTSFPLSQSWRPPDVGVYEITVAALSSEGTALGQATISLNVVEPAGGKPIEPPCSPGASFVTDVTIPPNTAFPPGARMEKVWRVRNAGSCAWGVGYQLALVEGMSLGAPTEVPVPPTAAGQPVDLAVTFSAPEEAGVYASVWQLQSPDGVSFGPTLTLSIIVGALAEGGVPPDAPTGLQAAVTASGKGVQLTWQDISDNEDAFRVYREDTEASIGLAPANAQVFVDESVACGRTYRYGVVAFNAAGASSIGDTVEVALPPCAPADAPPTLMLTVVPTQVLASETFTVVFRADDDLGLAQVDVQGQATGIVDLDAGRVFTCTETVCAGTWALTWGGEISETITNTLRLRAIAQDSSGQESDPSQVEVVVSPPE